MSALPTIPQLPIVRLPEKAVEEMRDYALSYGAAVRPRKNRQQTTMARHETMPEMIYQRQLQISANRDKLFSTESSEVKELEKERKDETNISPISVISIIGLLTRWLRDMFLRPLVILLSHLTLSLRLLNAIMKSLTSAISPSVLHRS